jgi:hypothetical protein
MNYEFLKFQNKPILQQVWERINYIIDYHTSGYISIEQR